VALAARGATGADVEAYVRRARGAARRGRHLLKLDDLLAEVRSRRDPPSAEDRRRLAVHEAGHAVAATMLGGMDVAGVTIGDHDGFTEIVSIRGSVLPERCHEILIMLLAGRAAEELVCGNPSAGAGGRRGSDLSRATELAKDMELRLGFGDLGPVFLPEGIDDPLATMPGLLASVRRRLDRAMSDAAALLARNRVALDEVAGRLSASGYLSATEIAEIVGAAIQPGNGESPSKNPENVSGTSQEIVRAWIEIKLADANADENGGAEESWMERVPASRPRTRSYENLAVLRHSP
jgi:ATP-dependent Zn protease